MYRDTSKVDSKKHTHEESKRQIGEKTQGRMDPPQRRGAATGLAFPPRPDDGHPPESASLVYKRLSERIQEPTRDVLVVSLARLSYIWVTWGVAATQSQN